MKKYKIIAKSITYERFLVEAESENEARELVLSGDVDCYNESNYNEAEVTSIEEAK